MEIAIVFGDDWCGLYINGVLVTEDHSLRNGEVIEEIIKRLPRLNMSFKELEADDNWLQNEGGLPKDLEDVKLIA